MLSAYERGEIVHVLGTHETLERGLKRYLIRKPYDLVDAAYYSYQDLRKPGIISHAPAVLTQKSRHAA
jgi:hypothetical protein